jgi:MYXO-CTERM domain-containing protein
MLVSSAAVALLGAANEVEAQADLGACNNIYVEAGGECTVIPPSVDCEADCTPIKVEASCAAKLQVQCDASCNANVDVGCDATCTADCMGECNLKPGEFNCQAYCQADCSGSCAAECAGGEGGAHCRASCEATCTGDCNAECKVTPPTADCNVKCEAGCKGSCHAKANIDCQAKCQADGFVKCEADVTGGCKVDCMSEKGALFCEGYYVDANDNAQMCLDALKAALDVDYYATAEGECREGMCTGKADASVGCSALPGDKSAASSLLLMLGGLAVYGARRRRQG